MNQSPANLSLTIKPRIFFPPTRENSFHLFQYMYDIRKRLQEALAAPFDLISLILRKVARSEGAGGVAKIFSATSG